MSFPRQPLSALGNVQTGSTPSTTNEKFWGGEIPFVTPAELDQNLPVADTPRTLTKEGGSQSRLLHQGAVMVCCIGSLGKIGIAGRTLVTNQQINSIQFNEQKIWPRYGYYACQRLKPKLQAMAPATTVPIVNKSKFEQLEIPIPPLPEQRRIAAILDQADALRATRREALAQLDSLTQSIFNEMFGDPTTNPKGWPTKHLADLVAKGDTINYGVIQPGDDFENGVPLVRVGDLIDGSVRHTQLKRIAPSIEGAYARSRLHGDEILVSCVGSVGVVVLADESVKGFNIARAVARVRLSNLANREFIAAHLQTASVQRYFVEELRTVSQPTLNIKQLSETEVMCPPLALQSNFANRLRIFQELKAAENRSRIDLDALFAALQHRAFRGEL